MEVEESTVHVGDVGSLSNVGKRVISSPMDNTTRNGLENKDVPKDHVNKKHHPKLVKQKSVTFGNVETEADGVITSIINLANDVQSEQHLNGEESRNAQISANVSSQTDDNRDSASMNERRSSLSSDAQNLRSPTHLHHFHHHHHHVTVENQTFNEVVDGRRMSNQSVCRRSSSLTSSRASHLRRAFRETWDSKLSFSLACLSCTLGMFNINKFSLLVARFGIAFIFEFVLLSILFGIPLFFMYAKIGQYTRNGIISMWTISPAFIGVGISIILMIWTMGIFSAIPVTWMINFFRDSFVSGKGHYKWRGCSHEYALRECVTTENSTSRIGIELISYFHGRILNQNSDKEPGMGTLNYENIIYLSLIWVVVFFCLSRGLKWYSKVIYVIAFVPEISVLAIVVRLIHSNEGIHHLVEQDFLGTLSDEMSWFCAAKEVVFTWVVFGALIIQTASYTKNVVFTNRILVIMATMSIMVLILFSCGLAGCMTVLYRNNLNVVLSSFDNELRSNFLSTNSSSSMMSSYPINLFFGTQFSTGSSSNYRIMRFSVELFPAAMAIKQMEDETATFWCALFYLTMIFLGVGQQMALARTVIESIIDCKAFKLVRWRTTITFIVCLSMLLMGIPVMSSNGMHIMYFVDFVLGTLWWIILLYLIVYLGIFHIEAPCDDKSLLAYISHQSIKPKVLAIAFVINWNIFCPAALFVILIIFLKVNKSTFIFQWEKFPYSIWNTELHVASVIFPIFFIAIPLLVFLFLVFQSYKKVNGQTTFLKILEDLIEPSEPLPKWPQLFNGSRIHSRASRSSSLGSRIFNFGISDDPPPKYTPPPSYSSATAKKLIREMDNLRIESGIDNISNVPNGEETDVDKESQLR